MCIAIYKPAGAELGRKRLRKCYNNNPDGAGYMFVDNDDKIVIKKGFFRFDKFWTSYRQDRSKYPESDFVIHFRIRTHGNVDKANCHPHRIDSRLAVAHNGTIYKVSATGEDSDTIVFVRSVLRNLPEDWEYSSGVNALIENYIGKSKLVFMHKNGQVWILNEELGEWDNGCWFSNDSYYKKRVRKSKGVGFQSSTNPTSGGTASTYTKSTGAATTASGTPRCPRCCEHGLYNGTEINRGLCWWCERDDSEKQYEDYAKKVRENPNTQYCAFVECGTELVFPHELKLGVCLECQDKHNMTDYSDRSESKPKPELSDMELSKEIGNGWKLIPAKAESKKPSADDMAMFRVGEPLTKDMRESFIKQGFELIETTDNGEVYGLIKDEDNNTTAMQRLR
jgi:hypothetical protein